jgi:DNA polymerase
MGCNDCFLRGSRQIFGEGNLPCDVLFVGEAPGKTEETLGRPFIGKSGRLLRNAIDEVKSRVARPFTYFISNCVCCRPTMGLDENRTPDMKEVEACRWHFHPLLRLAQPKGIILLGKIAERSYLKKLQGCGIILALPHPAFILRNGGTVSSHYRTLVRSIEDVLQRTTACQTQE